MSIDPNVLLNPAVPLWFKARSYAGLPDLDEVEWYLQFACRRC